MRSQTLFQNWEDVLIDGVPAFLFLWCCSVSLLAVCGVVVVLSVCGSLWLCWFPFWWWSVVPLVVCGCGVSLLGSVWFLFVSSFFVFLFLFFLLWLVRVAFSLLVGCLFFFFLGCFPSLSFLLLHHPCRAHPFLKFFPFPPFYLLVDLICVVTELQ